MGQRTFRTRRPYLDLWRVCVSVCVCVCHAGRKLKQPVQFVHLIRSLREREREKVRETKRERERAL